MHILLADDQQMVRSAIRLFVELQPEGHTVDEVTSAQELLDHVRNYCPGMLFLDWKLPGSTPENLLQKLRALCPHVYTVVLDSKPQTKQAALEAGANEFVSKNDPPERLLAAVRGLQDSGKTEKG